MDKTAEKRVLNGYQKLFLELQPTRDPRHIEAFLRMQFGVLDHLDRDTMAREAAIAVECIDVGGIDNAEQLAQSYGL